MENPKIAIHGRKGSFSDRWIEYCRENGIDYQIMNCYDTDIIAKLAHFDILLWHWSHFLGTDVIIARNVIKAAEIMGLKVFPDILTCWSFDDKIAQKYVLEAINAPLVPTYIFYDKETAIRWLQSTSLPKVFKLRKGAGSKNVRLVRSFEEGKKLIEQAFDRGFKARGGYFKDALGKIMASKDKIPLINGKIRRLPQSLTSIWRSNKFIGRESGYVYFQEFIPENKYDIRITVIGKRAFGFTRDVRKNDFRASGSGSINYSHERIIPHCVTIAFDVANKLASQSIAFDFVIDNKNKPKIVEISYCYLDTAVYNCGGYWDSELKWHQGNIWPQDAIIEDILLK